jgi:hypothetical protein
MSANVHKKIYQPTQTAFYRLNLTLRRWSFEKTKQTQLIHFQLITFIYKKFAPFQTKPTIYISFLRISILSFYKNKKKTLQAKNNTIKITIDENLNK